MRLEHGLEHARALLAGVDALQDKLENLTPEQRLELAIDGALAKANEDLRWTVELAIAHALVAIAESLEAREARHL